MHAESIAAFLHRFFLKFCTILSRVNFCRFQQSRSSSNDNDDEENNSNISNNYNHSSARMKETGQQEEGPPPIASVVTKTTTTTTTPTAWKDPGVVEVYILLGQSNMLGMGKVGSNDAASSTIHKDGTLACAVYQKGLYSYLIDHDDDNERKGRWVTSPTVRNVRVMEQQHGGGSSSMHVYHNEYLTIRNNDTIGPEFGIGHFLSSPASSATAIADANNDTTTTTTTITADVPILLLKSCIGNRSLGWDLLPPGSQRYEYKGTMYAGYGESPASWDKDKPKPAPIDWYAGKQYDTDIANAKSVLKELDKYYPDATKYKIAGFFWWQGDKDRYTEAYGVKYEQNLVRLIHQLRADFEAPDAKFVLATLGQTDATTATGTEQAILQAMLAVDGNSGEYPEFVGNVSTVYSHPLSKGGASNSHYNGNAETYMNVGEAMGKAMAEMVPRV